ncbi:hypothetical protein KKC67_01800, partial [Patescibacteria group bacterium]|nr:hypothetical protein [Patescibacteria group bacterium]
ASTGLTGGTITSSGAFALDLANANTWTKAQTLNDANLILNGTSVMNFNATVNPAYINSNRGIQLRLDADNNTIDEFAINNGPNLKVFSINESGAITTGSVPWERLSSLPSACLAGQYVSAIGSTLTCSAPSSGSVYTAGTGILIAGTTIENTANIYTATGSGIELENVYSRVAKGKKIKNTGVLSVTAGTGLSGVTTNQNVAIGLDLANPNTWTGAQTLNNANLILNGTSAIKANQTLSLISDGGVNIKLDANNTNERHSFSISNYFADPLFEISVTGVIMTKSVTWENIINLPAGFVDGIDNGITSFTTGAGLTGGPITSTPSTSGGTISLDLNSTNTWMGEQAFSAKAYLQKGAGFPGGGSWDASGNVGIGTAPSATEKLYVKGDVRIDGTTQATAGLFEKFVTMNVGGTNYLVPLYTQGTQPPPPVPNSPYSVIYSTYPNKHGGNFASNGDVNGRRGADAFCTTNKPASLNCTNIHAFISVTASDEIRDMPTNYDFNATKPIYWWDISKNAAVSQVAQSWADMLDGYIANTEEVGTAVTTTTPTPSGSYRTGALFAQHCKNWTSDSSGVMSGSMLTSSNTWLEASSKSCSEKLYYRCICIYISS